MRYARICCHAVATEMVMSEQDSLNVGEIIPRDAKSVIIAVPGNPGLVEFYREFISAVNSKVPTGTPTCVVGHAGHSNIPHMFAYSNAPGVAPLNCNTLEGQLKHKEEFINRYVPKDANLYLIGHSIGSWLILNLLKNQLLATRVVKCYMLFPTIEHMSLSPNGRFFTNVVTRITGLLKVLLWMFSILPLFVQTLIVRTYVMFRGIPVTYIQPIIQLLNPSVLKRVFLLAKDEMRHVKKLDHDLVSKNADKLWLYYGTTDNWTPVTFYANMRSKYPNVDAELCHLGFEHSFVLKSATQMGHMVGELINENMSKG